MKNVLLLITAISISGAVFAQHTASSLEKELASIDVGFIGTWITYERKVGEQFTVNTQLGLGGGFFGGGGEFNYAFTPSVAVEPRFYYNFNKRVAKEKRTINNSANYFALDGTFIPDLFTITDDEIDIVRSFTLVPKWGLRRSMGKRFKFDFAIGYGVAFRENRTDDQFGLDVRIGYVFYR